MHPTLNIAKHAAEAAGRIQLFSLEKLDRVKIQEKNPNDYVSDVDTRAEAVIVDTIRKYHPDHAILAEESGQSSGDADNCWIIDPLDGTNNFLHGIPHFCISIAFQHKGVTQSGLIYDPVRKDMFIAARGKGAHLNESRIRTTQRSSLDGAIVGYEHNYPASWEAKNHALTQLIFELNARQANTRRLGASALDLAYVAAGRFDGFFSHHLKPWDMAAGALLVEEAGGLVSDYTGAQNHFESGEIVCGSLRIFKPLLKLINHRLVDKHHKSEDRDAK